MDSRLAPEVSTKYRDIPIPWPDQTPHPTPIQRAMQIDAIKLTLEQLDPDE